MPTKSLLEEEAPKILNTEVFKQTRRSTLTCRTAPERQRFGQDRSAREKSVRANGPNKNEQNEGAVFLEPTFGCFFAKDRKNR